MHKLIKNRRSVRKFIDKDLEDKKVLEIVKASFQAPSAKNQQPWLIHIEKDPLTIKKMSEVLPNLKFASNAKCVLVYLMMQNENITVMAPQDMASSVTMGLLEAHHQGVGACWGGIYPKEERMNIVRDVFNLHDTSYVPFAIVPLGYPEDNQYYYIKRFDKKRLI